MEETHTQNPEQNPEPHAAAPAQPQPHASHGQNKTLLAVIAYIGPLAVVSYLLSDNEPFAKFHARQGVVVFGIELLAWVLSMMFWPFWMIINIINVATLILSVIGIVYALQGKQKELPLVGHLAHKVTF